MADWLSADWAVEAAGLCHLLPEAPGATGTVALSFLLAPRKEVAIHWRYEDGRPAAGGPGPAPDADLTLTVGAADAADVLSGRIEPSVAFMRGRLKATGDGALLLAFLESTTSGGYAGWRDAMAGIGPVPPQ